MKRVFKTAAAMLIATTSMAAAFDGTIEDIKVQAELGDAADRNILAHYPTIEADLESAIAQRMSDMVGDEGHSVTVRLKEIGLSGTKAGTGIEEFNRLSGWVTLYDEAGEMVDNVELTLNAKTGDTELPPNTVGVVWPSTEDFYQAMIGAFADETAEWVKKI